MPLERKAAIIPRNRRGVKSPGRFSWITLILSLDNPVFRRSPKFFTGVNDVPIYEYKCERCDHQLEILQKISDDPATTCPECSEDGLRKLVSAAAFKLKGTGWYETDFKDKKPAGDDKTGGTDSGNQPSETGSRPAGDDKASGTDSQDSSDSKDKPADSKSESKTSKPDSGASTTKKAAGSG